MKLFVLRLLVVYGALLSVMLESLQCKYQTKTKLLCLFPEQL